MQIARHRIDFDNYEVEISTVISCALQGEGCRWTTIWTRQGPDLPTRPAPTSTARRRRIRGLQTPYDINSVYCPIAQHDELLLTASSISSLLPDTLLSSVPSLPSYLWILCYNKLIVLTRILSGLACPGSSPLYLQAFRRGRTCRFGQRRTFGRQARRHRRDHRPQQGEFRLRHQLCGSSWNVGANSVRSYRP